MQNINQATASVRRTMTEIINGILMVQTPIYMDNHATTRVDPRVVEAMLPYFSTIYGNAGSVSHEFGHDAAGAVDAARQIVAKAVGAAAKEIVFTSGATESVNLALRGIAERARKKGGHFISVATEHKAVLDPLRRLSRRGFETTLLPVEPAGKPNAGWLDPQRVADALRDDTLLVSVMLANNETGVIHPLSEIGRICRDRGVLLHSDATQAVGRIPVDVKELHVDMLSFSAHKFYGPKGVGALYVRRSSPHFRLEPTIEGGGQEGGVRSGTLNVPGIVGMAKALEPALANMSEESTRLQQLRNHLADGLRGGIDDWSINGPHLDDPNLRLTGNLNCSFGGVDGEALMMSMRDIAVSSGSACTSANPEPSHVLRAMGLSDDLVRSSLRFGLGRFNTMDEVDFAIHLVCETVDRLRKLAS